MKVRKKFNVDLSLNNLFETPTIATFSREVEKAKSADTDSRVSAIAPVSRDLYRINKTN
jgi:hypothetical protein